jgi:glucose-6-phosphate-specific signal transduction histidine kinase
MATTEQLLHLADRARRGVALDAEHDQLAAGIAALGEQAARADRVARSAAREAAEALTAQLAAEARLARVRRLLDRGPIGTCCDRYLRAALDAPQPPTTT